MLIGELAKVSGLSKDGIRHYEAMGLIASAPRQRSAGPGGECMSLLTEITRPFGAIRGSSNSVSRKWPR